MGTADESATGSVFLWSRFERLSTNGGTPGTLLVLTVRDVSNPRVLGYPSGGR